MSKSGYGLGEAEILAVREPVAIPALVPAFDQHAAKAVWRREVDVALAFRRWSRRASGPRPRSRVPRCMPHQMPTYLNGLTHDTSPSLLGSLRLRMRSDMYRPGASSAICSVRHGVANGAVRLHLRPARRRRQRRLQPLARHAPQPHGRIVDQRRFVDGDVQRRSPACSVSGVCACADFGQRRLVVEILVAIPLAARNPPRGGRLRDRELGELLDDVHLRAARPAREIRSGNPRHRRTRGTPP